MSSLTHEAKHETASETPPERPNVLARIEAYKRREIAEAKLRVPLAKLERKVTQAEPVRGFAAAIRAALPDLAHVQEAVVVEPTPDGGALAAVRSRLAGTHRGAFLGVAPTGRPVAIRTMDMHRVGPDGRIAETWHLEDFFGLFRQLGAAPAGPPATPPAAPEPAAHA